MTPFTYGIFIATNKPHFCKFSGHIDLENSANRRFVTVYLPTVKFSINLPSLFQQDIEIIIYTL